MSHRGVQLRFSTIVTGALIFFVFPSVFLVLSSIVYVHFSSGIVSYVSTGLSAAVSKSVHANCSIYVLQYSILKFKGFPPKNICHLNFDDITTSFSVVAVYGKQRISVNILVIVRHYYPEDDWSKCRQVVQQLSSCARQSLFSNF